MKKLFKILLVLLLLAVLGITVFLLTFDLDRYRQPIMNEMSATLNRPVHIEKLNLKISLVPTVTIRGIEIENPVDMKSEKSFAKIDSVDVRLSLISLIKRKIQINAINVGPTEVLLLNKNGKNNWNFAFSKTDNKKAIVPGPKSESSNVFNGMLSKVRIDNISIEKLIVNYQNEKETRKIIISDFVLKQLKAFSGIASYNGQNINLSGTVNDIMDLIQKKKDYLFNIEAQACDVTAKISGSIGNLKTLDNILLTINIYTNNLRKSASALGVLSDKVSSGALTLKSLIKGNLDELVIDKVNLEIGTDLIGEFKGKIRNLSKNPIFNLDGAVDLKSVQLAALYGIKPLNVQFAAEGTAEQIVVTNFALTANKSDIGGVVNISLKRMLPFIKGEFKSNYFDLTDIIANSSNSYGEQKKNYNNVHSNVPSIFSEQKIDLGALRTFNAQLGFNFAHLIVMGNTNNYYSAVLQTQLLDGFLTINPLRVQMLGGNLNGLIQVDAKRDTPSFKVRLTGSNLALDKFKTIAKTLKGSVANIALNLTASGQSSKAIVSYLNGNIEVELTEGKILNKWFNELPNVVGLFSKNRSFSYSKTDAESRLNCAALNLPVKNGVITLNKGIAVETSTINVVVSGDVNLPQEKLSISMMPSVNQLLEKTNDKLKLTQIIRVEGPFLDLKTKLDTKSAVEGLIQKGVEKGLNKLSPNLLGERLNTNTKAETDSNPIVGSLCQTALGHKLKGNVKEVSRQQKMEVQKTQMTSSDQKSHENLSPKEILKNQLMRSLTDVLKK